MISHHKLSRQMRRSQERKSNKAERAELNADAENFKQIRSLINKVLNENQIEELAKKIGVIKRKRKISPLAFVTVLLIGCVCDTDDNGMRSLKRMTSLLRKYNSTYISPQTLQKKINTKQTSIFFKEILLRIMAFKINKHLKKILKKRSGRITFQYRILLQDSTVFSLPESLKRIFRGFGGNGSEAGIKCDYIIDQSNHLVLHVKFVAGRIPDSAMSPDIIKYLQKDDLIIRDLGYFNLSQFSKIVSKQAKFISRLSNAAHVYLHKNDEKPLNLFEYLEILEKERKSMDIDVFVGKTERLSVRLIGIKVPSEVVEARRIKHKKLRNKQEPSQDLKNWHGYTFMITNISRDDLSLKMILKLYKIRWQIELFFKNIKSNLSLDKVSGKNKYRVLCIIYIKVAIAHIVTGIYAFAQGLIGLEKEVSLDQLTKWLKEEGRLKMAFLDKNMYSIFDELKRDVDLLCKQKRKRKSTLDDIEESYKESGNEKVA